MCSSDHWGCVRYSAYALTCNAEHKLSTCDLLLRSFLVSEITSLYTSDDPCRDLLKVFFFFELSCRETSILNLLQPNLQESFVSNDELFHHFFFECSNRTFLISYNVFLSDLKFAEVSIIPNRTFDWMANVKKLWVILLFPQQHYLLVTTMPRLYCSHNHSYKAAKGSSTCG